jgi:hypothetical protein
LHFLILKAHHLHMVLHAIKIVLTHLPHSACYVDDRLCHPSAMKTCSFISVPGTVGSSEPVNNCKELLSYYQCQLPVPTLGNDQFMLLKKHTFIIFQFWKSKVCNGSHWAKIKVLATFLLGGCRGELVSLSFPVSRVCPHSLTPGSFLSLQT